MVLTETMLADTFVGVVPVLALLMRSRRLSSVSPAETVMTLPSMVKVLPSVSPSAVDVLATASDEILWAAAVCRISILCEPTTAALVIVTPRSAAAEDGVAPSVRLTEAKASLALKISAELPTVAVPRMLAKELWKALRTLRNS